MSPLHHHYQKLGYHESKIVTRFWIITILCVAFAIATLEDQVNRYMKNQTNFVPDD
jgi:UDP-N-acetylmuramyl pentapeptide phosphotransferase/UDP-N-acetylglucosamine-1-phosphate transferase